MPARSPAPCILCRQTIEISDAGAAIQMNLRLVGVTDLPNLCRALGIPTPSSSECGQCYMCIECCVELAMGKIPPPTQPLSLLAHELISRLTGKNPAVIITAWQQLRERIELPAVNFGLALAEGEVLPPAPRLLQKNAG